MCPSSELTQRMLTAKPVLIPHSITLVSRSVGRYIFDPSFYRYFYFWLA